jgi:tryptophanyl-tRNA synthetase
MIADKIRRAKTDPEPLPTEAAGLENRPEARNLTGIYAALTDTDHQGVLNQHGGKGFAAFKQDLTALLVDKLTPIATETRRLLADPGTVESILRTGANKAETLALPIVEEAEKLVGFLKA